MQSRISKINAEFFVNILFFQCLFINNTIDNFSYYYLPKINYNCNNNLKRNPASSKTTSHMKILDYNDSHILLTNLTPNPNIPSICKTYLLKSPSLSTISQYTGYYQCGSLQYATGIAALATGSTVKIYDFVYQRKILEIQTILPIVQVRIIKNLVLCVADQRILIYDVATGSNLCHIPTSNGKLATISNSYYSLKLLYPAPDPYSSQSSPSIFTRKPSSTTSSTPTATPSSISPSPNPNPSPNPSPSPSPSYPYSCRVFHQQQIWANKMKKIQCNTACSILQYDRTADILCLGHHNVIGLYLREEIVRGCQFNGRIVWVKASKAVDGKFYVLIHNQHQGSNNQLGQEKKQQIKQIQQQKVQASTDIINNNTLNNISLVQVTLAHKQYLKPQLLQIYTAQLSTSQPLYFQHSNTIHIWHNNSIYTTVIDNEPVVNKNYKKQKIQLNKEQRIENKNQLKQTDRNNQSSTIILKEELLLKVSDIDIIVKNSNTDKRQEEYLKEIQKQLQEIQKQQMEQQQNSKNYIEGQENKQNNDQQNKEKVENSEQNNNKQQKQDKKVYKGFRQSMKMEEIDQDQVFNFQQQKNQDKDKKQSSTTN